MKAKEWLERGMESTDPIDMFSNSWRGFNNLFYRSSGRIERTKIRNYLIDNVSEDVSTSLLHEYSEEVYYLLSQPVIDMRGNGEDTGKYIKRYRTSSTNQERIVALFLIVYQVRCNLEHGQKSPNQDRDIKLCSSSWPLVAEVVDKSA